MTQFKVLERQTLTQTVISVSVDDNEFEFDESEWLDQVKEVSVDE